MNEEYGRIVAEERRSELAATAMLEVLDHGTDLIRGLELEEKVVAIGGLARGDVRRGLLRILSSGDALLTGIDQVTLRTAD
jgi:hypothetical protein